MAVTTRGRTGSDAVDSGIGPTSGGRPAFGASPPARAIATVDANPGLTSLSALRAHNPARSDLLEVRRRVSPRRWGLPRREPSPGQGGVGARG